MKEFFQKYWPVLSILVIWFIEWKILHERPVIAEIWLVSLFFGNFLRHRKLDCTLFDIASRLFIFGLICIFISEHLPKMLANRLETDFSLF